MHHYRRYLYYLRYQYSHSIFIIFIFIIGSKQFVCKDLNCKYSADRDASAARNIVLRYLTVIQMAPAECASSDSNSPITASLSRPTLVTATSVSLGFSDLS